MQVTTKYDTIINFFLNSWIIASIILIIVVIMAIPQLWDGIKTLYDCFFNRNKGEKAIGEKIDTQLLRLLITANDAIRKENQDSYLHGCGSAFYDVYALSEYLVKFKVRYQKDKDAKVIIDANDDFYNLDKASECNGGLEEPRYYKVLERVQKSIQNLLDKRLPKST